MNSSQSSPGFVYFNTSSANKSDTQDFLAFNETPQECSSPYRNKFSPGNYSSPQSFRGGRGRGRGHNPWQRKPGDYKKRTMFNSFDTSGNRNLINLSRNKSQDGNVQKVDISLYVHPSFMEDPWAKLEEQLKLKKEQEKLNSQENKPDNQETEEQSLNKSSDLVESEENCPSN